MERDVLEQKAATKEQSAVQTVGSSNKMAAIDLSSPTTQTKNLGTRLCVKPATTLPYLTRAVPDFVFNGPQHVDAVQLDSLDLRMPSSRLEVML